jgi:hypothetical protein
MERPRLPRGLFRALGGCGTHRRGRHTGRPVRPVQRQESEVKLTGTAKSSEGQALARLHVGLPHLPHRRPAVSRSMEANGRPGLGTQAQVQQLVHKLEEMIVNAHVFTWVRDCWTQNKGTLGLNMSRAHSPTTSDHALPCTCCICSLATLLLTVDSTGFRKRDLVEVEHLSCVTDAHTTCTTPSLGGLHRAIVSVGVII